MSKLIKLEYVPKKGYVSKKSKRLFAAEPVGSPFIAKREDLETRVSEEEFIDACAKSAGIDLAELKPSRSGIVIGDGKIMTRALKEYLPVQFYKVRRRTLNIALSEIKWQDILKWDPSGPIYPGEIPDTKKVPELRPSTIITEDLLKELGKQIFWNSEATREDIASWCLYTIIRNASNLTKSERFELADKIRGDTYLCSAAEYTPDLTNEQRLVIFNKIKSSYYRWNIANRLKHLPNLTKKQKAFLKKEAT